MSNATQAPAAQSEQVERKPYLQIYPQSTTFDSDLGYSIRGTDGNGVKVDRRISYEEALNYLDMINASDHTVTRLPRAKRREDEPTRWDDVVVGMIEYDGASVECRVVSKAVLGLAIGLHRFMRNTNTQVIKAALRSVEGATEAGPVAKPVMIPA